MTTTLEPWPVSILPDNSNGVLMSDGSLKFFRSYGRAQSFLEHNPAPTAREQVEASLWAEKVDRTLDQFEAEDNDRLYAVDPDEVD